MNIVPRPIDMDSWDCCRCGYTNTFVDICDNCEHIRCICCESEEEEDSEHFYDFIIPH